MIHDDVRDTLFKALKETGLPVLPDKWDGFAEFVKAVAKVRKSTLSDEYVLIDWDRHILSDFGAGRVIKIIEVYPFQYKDPLSNKADYNIPETRSKLIDYILSNNKGKYAKTELSKLRLIELQGIAIKEIEATKAPLEDETNN